MESLTKGPYKAHKNIMIYITEKFANIPSLLNDHDC